MLWTKQSHHVTLISLSPDQLVLPAKYICMHSTRASPHRKHERQNDHVIILFPAISHRLLSVVYRFRVCKQRENLFAVFLIVPTLTLSFAVCGDLFFYFSIISRMLNRSKNMLATTGYLYIKTNCQLLWYKFLVQLCLFSFVVQPMRHNYCRVVNTQLIRIFQMS